MEKYLIAGLGNMEKAYFGTRHNVGFDVADAIAEKLGAGFTTENYAHTSRAAYRGRKLLIIKPVTYMNLSGKAIAYWLQKEQIPPERLLVILDDLNIPFGSIRIRSGGSDGGHNGLRSIQESLQSTKYPRLRIGLGNAFAKGKQVDFVLGPWSEEEKKILPGLLTWSAEAVLSWCFNGLQQAMNAYNKATVPGLPGS
ncbi:MAG: aminoacyl-tRNA hydrolase [Saprospiraceae bacterium]|nr:aminoacyl-tRNA hydrolase [Saprospiraceae bacterium]MBP9208683.1 aminoacyl-tRNA hydrolase [Saprospiraceae bacterium]